MTSPDTSKVARVDPAFGNCWASPVAAGGKVFVLSEDGKAGVLKAGAAWQLLSMEELNETCYATPALGRWSRLPAHVTVRHVLCVGQGVTPDDESHADDACAKLAYQGGGPIGGPHQPRRICCSKRTGAAMSLCSRIR